MKKIILLPFLIISMSLSAQINKVDHFFAGSPKAEALFTLFSKKLGLPVAWGFKEWTDFSSGGIGFGNVAFEFAYYKGVSKTAYEGIALEPRQPVEEIIQLFDKTSIKHDTIEPTTFVMSNGKKVGWSNMTLRNLMPDEAGLFICDYKDREMIIDNNKKCADSLLNSKGGPLGVIALQQIVVGSTNYSQHITELAKLPGISRDKENMFNFEKGPALQLKRSNTNGIEKIIIKVYSIEIAKNYLRSQNLLGEATANSVFIDPKALDGLLVELTDK